MSTEVSAEFAHYITDREVARLSGFSRAFFQQLRRKGGGPPFYRPGGRKIVYLWPEVEAWILAARVKGGQR